MRAIILRILSCLVILATTVNSLPSHNRDRRFIPYKRSVFDQIDTNSTTVILGNSTTTVITGNVTTFLTNATIIIVANTTTTLIADDSLTLTLTGGNSTTVLGNLSLPVIPTTRSAAIFPTGNSTLNKRFFDYAAKEPAVTATAGHQQVLAQMLSASEIPPPAAPRVRSATDRDCSGACQKAYNQCVDDGE